MTRAIRFTRTADDDLDRIWLYAADYDVATADRLIDRLRNAASRLIDYPRSAPVRFEKGPLRGLSAHRHILFYVFDDATVTITRVFDARQNWREYLLK